MMIIQKYKAGNEGNSSYAATTLADNIKSPYNHLAIFGKTFYKDIWQQNKVKGEMDLCLF